VPPESQATWSSGSPTLLPFSLIDAELFTEHSPVPVSETCLATEPFWWEGVHDVVESPLSLPDEATISSLDERPPQRLQTPPAAIVDRAYDLHVTVRPVVPEEPI
jgi:hypothetical protein